MKDNRVALVTGASRGIGRAVALGFGRSGYRVALVATNRDLLGDVVEEIAVGGSEAIAIDGTLDDPTFSSTIVPSVLKTYGRLDILVNNAAWREVVTMRHITHESWERTLSTCLTAPAFLARDAAKAMEPDGSGVIINISSVQSDQVPGLSPAYVAAKAGLEALTYELATLYGPAGIRVVAIAPGAIDTDMGKEITARAPAEYSTDFIPLRRWGTPEEIAEVVIWLATSGASYVSGTRVVVDGGWSHQQSPYSWKKRVLPSDF